MSLLAEATATCPTCTAVTSMEFPASINADRRPDLRAAILDGSMFTLPCRTCGEVLTFEPHLAYLDVGRRQWILAQSTDDRANWEQAERDAVGVYDLAFGASAPAAARAIGSALRPRLVFGWPALIEKLLCHDLGLDDVALEALKFATIANATPPELDPDLDLRLVGEQDGNLMLHWIDPSDGAPTARMQIPQSAYVMVKGGGDAWAKLTGVLAGRMFVDIGRVLREPAPATS